MQDYIQPIHQHQDGLINTYRGKLFDYNNVTAAMINLDDIAKGLSNICRFGGQINQFYSVAEHTLLVWDLSPTWLRPAALLHDAAEAYIGDVVKPFKNLLGKSFTDFEEKIERVIFEKYDVPFEHLALIKEYDMKALELENTYLRQRTTWNSYAFIATLYYINDDLSEETPYYQLVSLLRAEFLQRELFYKPAEL